MLDVAMMKADEIQRILKRTIEDQGCGPSAACSALANELLARLVGLKKQPQHARVVAEEMRRLAAKLMELAALEGDAADRGLADLGIIH